MKKLFLAAAAVILALAGPTTGAANAQGWFYRNNGPTFVDRLVGNGYRNYNYGGWGGNPYANYGGNFYGNGGCNRGGWGSSAWGNNYGGWGNRYGGWGNGWNNGRHIGWNHHHHRRFW